MCSQLRPYSKDELDRLNGLQEKLASTEEERMALLKQKDQLEEEIRKLKVRGSHYVVVEDLRI